MAMTTHQTEHVLTLAASGHDRPFRPVRSTCVGARSYGCESRHMRLIVAVHDGPNEIKLVREWRLRSPKKRITAGFTLPDVFSQGIAENHGSLMAGFVRGVSDTERQSTPNSNGLARPEPWGTSTQTTGSSSANTLPV